MRKKKNRGGKKRGAVAKPSAPTPGNCRVFERFACDAPASCQPSADWGVEWSGQVRDVSAGGLCLVLMRRFEPGVHLAVELPGTDGTASSTILARVVHVRTEPGGFWALGCRFVNPVGEGAVQALLHSGPAAVTCSP
jgi:hypothetical protein